MYNVLIIDDSPLICTVIGDYLESEGIHYNAYNSAKEARVYLRSNVPDIIILDIAMPDENGLEFLKYLKSKKKYDQIPVIILSGNMEMATFAKNSSYSADAYIEKPCNLVNLTNKIRELLSNVHE